MDASSILIAGHSHIAALGVPLLRKSYEIVTLDEGELPIVGLAGGWPRESSDYWEQVAARASGCVVAIFWRGNQHFHQFSISLGDSFDFMLDSEPDLPVDGTGEIVAVAAVSAFMHADMEDLETIVEDIKAAGGIPALCGTPPPKGDATFVKQMMLRERYFRDAAEDLGVNPEDATFSSPLFLYKLWRVMQDCLREIAERHGIPFVAVPRQGQTEEGFLHPQCYAQDATHANAHYGRLMLDELKLSLGQYLDAHAQS